MLYRYRCYRRIKAKGKRPDGHGHKLCGGRKTLKKMIEFYVRRPLCPNCGQDSLVFDKHRNKFETGSKYTNLCRCDGLGYPHRLGSKWCNEYQGEYEEEDYYYRPIGTC